MRNLGNKFFFWLSVSLLVSIHSKAQLVEEVISRCGAFEQDSARAAQDPMWRAMREANERSIREFQNRSSKQGRLLEEDEVIKIPVVVHVVSKNSADFREISSNVNISDAQVYSQIQVLNEDYRRLAYTPGFNDDPRGADTRIQFELAQFDIHGRPIGTYDKNLERFTGINRIQTNKESYRICTTCNTEEELANLTVNDFPPTHYLNIWVTRLTGGYLGVGQFPLNAEVDGLDTDGLREKTDGVIIDYRYFGRDGVTNTNRLYADGRTTTHEVGHWLGLRHIWGDARCGDDYVDDTPWSDSKNENSCLDVYTTCPQEEPFTRKMIENFMDYTPDACMNIFTKGQVARMRAVLETAPLRKELVRNSKLSVLEDTPQLSLTMFPNPTQDWMQLAVTFEGTKTLQVSIYNSAGGKVYEKQHANSKSRYIPLTLTTLPQGVYILKVTTGSETVSKSFIKH